MSGDARRSGFGSGSGSGQIGRAPSRPEPLADRFAAMLAAGPVLSKRVVYPNSLDGALRDGAEKIRAAYEPQAGATAQAVTVTGDGERDLQAYAARLAAERPGTARELLLGLEDALSGGVYFDDDEEDA